MTDPHDDRRTDDSTDAQTDDRRWSEEARRVHRETVQRAVARVVPEWTVTGATPAEAGHQIVYLLTVDTPRGERDCVLKATAPGSIAAAGSEARFLTWLDAATTVPVPEVYGVVDADAPGLPTPLFLMERLEGERTRRDDLAEVPVSRVETLARVTGETLATLHARSPDRFGFLTCEVETPLAGGCPPAEPTLSVDGHPDWPTFYRRTTEETLEAVAESRFADVVPDARPAVERDIERLEAGGPYRPAVAHIDGNLDNLLFDGDELVGMLDWEFTMSTPPAYDVVCMAWGLAGGHRRFLPEVPDHLGTVREALLAGYREGAGGAVGDSTERPPVDADRVIARVRTHGDDYRLLAALRSMHLFEDVFDRFGLAGDRRDAAARALREAVGRMIEDRE